MFPTLLRRMAASPKEPLLKRAPLTVASNPYKARKVWPPNFKQLTHQQQLRFEKKYKRRIVLASRSPRWEKAVKFAQLATIVGKYLPAGLESVDHRLTLPSCHGLDPLLLRIRRKTQYLFGTLDPEKRFERSPDAPPPPPPKDGPESK
ncbi:hypothetical protein ACJZ2D_013829 [Fusarium nematophilum]